MRRPRLCLLPLALWSACLGLGVPLPNAPAQSGAPAAPVFVGIARSFGHGDHLQLAGGWSPKQGWRDAEQARRAYRPGTRFRLFGLSGGPRSLSVGAIESGEESGGWFWSGERSHVVPANTAWLAVANVRHKLVPRPVRAQSPGSAIYRQALVDFLRARGVRASGVRLKQLVRVDLNGDGIDEVLLAADSRPDVAQNYRVRAGDFSLVLLRFLGGGGQVKAVMIAGDVYPQATDRAILVKRDLVACADVNGNGKMEVAVNETYYEGGAVALFSFDGKRVRTVLHAGFGD